MCAGYKFCSSHNSACSLLRTMHIMHVFLNGSLIMQIRCTKICRVILKQPRRVSAVEWRSAGVSTHFVCSRKFNPRVADLLPRASRMRQQRTSISPSTAIFHHASFIIMEYSRRCGCRCRRLSRIKFTRGFFSLGSSRFRQQAS